MTQGQVTARPLHWVVAGFVAVCVAGLGGALSDIGEWYFDLAKPSWQPPDWLFGPAWTLIFVCAVFAGVKGWRAAENSRTRSLLLALFLANAVFNVLWSLLFFYQQRPDLALLEVPLLWASVLALIVLLWPRSRAAAALLLPYLAWVSFAAVLNFTIVQLNQSTTAG
jgi:tryptophan-rich sensory protein